MVVEGATKNLGIFFQRGWFQTSRQRRQLGREEEEQEVGHELRGRKAGSGKAHHPLPGPGKEHPINWWRLYRQGKSFLTSQRFAFVVVDRIFAWKNSCVEFDSLHEMNNHIGALGKLEHFCF